MSPEHNTPQTSSPASSRSRTAPDHATAALVRLAAVHAGIIFVPAFLLVWLLTTWWLGLILAIVVAAGVTALRMRDMDARVTVALGARPAGPDEQPRLHNLVEHLAMAVGVAAPVVHVIDDPALNAVAWGTGNGPASMAATTGLLAEATRIELEAVVAHVLTDIHDEVISAPTVAAALFGSRLPRPLASLALGALTDVRVVAADLEAARVTRYPPGSVGALERIRAGSAAVRQSPPALRPLWLVDPVEAGSSTPDAFALHPPLADRIDLLREL